MRTHSRNTLPKLQRAVARVSLHAAPAFTFCHMPGLLIPVKHSPVPALLRCNHGHVRLCAATTAQTHVTRLPPRGVASRSKSTSTVCKASSEKGSSPVDKTAGDFLTMTSNASPFKDVGATVLTDLFNKGQQINLPAGYKLSEEGAAPTACHILLHSCFLRSDGEGDCSICRKCF